jgi:hypothetical protein
VLRQQSGQRRLRFNNDQRRRLAVRAKGLGIKLLREVATTPWDLIVAADFFTIEAWTRRGLQRFVILFFMELSTRMVKIARMASSPSGLWMNQIGRNLRDAVDGMLNGKHASCMIAIGCLRPRS